MVTAMLAYLSYYIAQPALEMLVHDRTDSAAGLAAATYLPIGAMMATSYFWGRKVDKWSAQRVRAFTEIVQFAVYGILLVLFVVGLTGAVTVPLLYAIGMAVGAAVILEGLAQQNEMKANVNEEELTKANSTMTIVGSASKMCGSLIGVTIAGWGMAWAFATTAALSLLVALAVGLPETRRRTASETDSENTSGSTTGPDASTSDQEETGIDFGFVWIWERPENRTVILIYLAIIGALGAEIPVLLLFADERLHSGGSGYGQLRAALGAGAIVGGLAARWLLPNVEQRKLLVAGLVVALPAQVWLALTDRLWIAVVLIAVTTFWQSMLAVRGLRISQLADSDTAAVGSSQLTMISGTSAAAGLVSGLVADAWGITASVWLGVLLLSVALLCLLMPRTFRRLVSNRR
jgi:predicted MFS family arabinose efflux permease